MSKGLSEQSGKAIVRERVKRAFISIDDLQNRVPELRKDEMRKLAAIGALNFIQQVQSQSPKSKSQESQSPIKSKSELRLWTLDFGLWTSSYPS